MRRMLRVVLVAGLALGPAVLAGQERRPVVRADSMTTESRLVLIQAEEVVGFRVLRYGLAAVLVVAALGWIGRSRAARDDD